MALLSFINVSKIFNTDLILDHVSFQINKNEKVALIGDNGTGKTTIMKLILKEIEPTLMPKEDRVGEISILKDTKIGYLDQNAIKNINNTVKEELEEVFVPFKKLEEELNKITEKLSKEPENEIYLKKYNEIIENDVYTSNFDYENQIKTLVSKFSFPLSILDKQINSLSGGERMKIAFIKILLSKYDFLLLDEPTNHLDISTIEWLENYLKDYNGTILFISHDRYFIEKVSNKILELEHEKITTYNTTYEGYLKEKEDRYKLLMEQYKKEEEKMAHYKKFIEFYRYKPRFVGRVKDRIKKLERIEENHVEPPKKENKNIKINLEGGNLKNKELLEVKDLIVGYSSPLLPSISFSLYGKDKLAIIGDNGIGKTTLIKTILGEIPPLLGKILEKRKLDIGYIKQNDCSFKKGEDILSHLKNIYPLKSEKELRSALGRFLFKKEDVFKETSTLSNGEKMRVNLCALMLSSYDLFFRKNISLDTFNGITQKYPQLIGITQLNNFGYIISMFSMEQQSLYFNVTNTKAVTEAYHQAGKDFLLPIFEELKASAVPFSKEDVCTYHIQKDTRWKYAFDILKKQEVTSFVLNPVGVYIGIRQLTRICEKPIPMSIFYA